VGKHLGWVGGAVILSVLAAWVLRNPSGDLAVAQSAGLLGSSVGQLLGRSGQLLAIAQGRAT
jgi:hypothetical protein